MKGKSKPVKYGPWWVDGADGNGVQVSASNEQEAREEGARELRQPRGVPVRVVGVRKMKDW